MGGSVWASNEPSGVKCAAAAVEYLTPELLEFLADLHGSPDSLAQAAVQLLPFGSRSALLATGVVSSSGGGGSGRAGEEGLRLTPLGFEVIALAGAADESRQLDDLVAKAAAIVEAHEHAGGTP
jgi:hypothetical protein